ncbi:MAG TPA: hypothetical protein VF194_01265 [Ferrovibrio sp.]|uniref:hypothetical protein n=1 Tax=Ferrovibrio sp. TaxID=1917215 RepID=UPI002ED038FF
MRRVRFALLALAVYGAGTALHGAAVAREPAKPMALIPFELERAKERGDRAVLNLNEDVTRVPGFRISELPVVDGKLGEHAKLDNVEIYFPYGRIVTATAEFHKYRITRVSSGTAAMLDPRYQRVRSFDQQLGKVCASEIGSNGEKVEMRIAPNRVMSVVHVLPPQQPGVDGDTSPSYRVTSGLELRFLSRKEPMAEQLYRECRRPAGTKLTQKG